MRVELSSDGRDFSRQAWTDLVAQDPASTLFHTPKYLRLYWEEFGSDLELTLAFFEENGETVGAVALERSGSTVRFLGGTEVTDYMGPVGRPGTEERVAKELLGALDSIDGWTEADLRGLPEAARGLAPLGEAGE